jgi:hypothetical protein
MIMSEIFIPPEVIDNANSSLQNPTLGDFEVHFNIIRKTIAHII